MEHFFPKNGSEMFLGLYLDSGLGIESPREFRFFKQVFSHDIWPIGLK